MLDNDTSFEIFGKVGLLYLMFLAGIEIDMYHLRLNLRRGLVFGLLTFLLPMAVGVAASVYLLHLDMITSVLLASMYASHTLIAYPVTARFGITKSPAVLIAIVGTIIAVIGALARPCRPRSISIAPAASVSPIFCCCWGSSWCIAWSCFIPIRGLHAGFSGISATG